MLLTTRTAMISYGCPRSGTTPMNDLLQLGVGYLYFRLTELAVLHPCHSGRGLRDLHQAVTINKRDRHCIIVRTVRHPLEIASSAWVAWHQGDWRTTPGAQTPRLLSPDNIASAIRAESTNTALQRDKVPILEVRYESLAEPNGRETFLAALATQMQAAELPFIQNVHLFRGFLNEYWGKRPIGEGRMALGDKAKPPPKEQVEEWRHELADIIVAEGYT